MCMTKRGGIHLGIYNLRDWFGWESNLCRLLQIIDNVIKYIYEPWNEPKNSKLMQRPTYTSTWELANYIVTTIVMVVGLNSKLLFKSWGFLIGINGKIRVSSMWLLRSIVNCEPKFLVTTTTSYAIILSNTQPPTPAICLTISNHYYKMWVQFTSPCSLDQWIQSKSNEITWHTRTSFVVVSRHAPS
jgi:hypothetical protein